MRREIAEQADVIAGLGADPTQFREAAEEAKARGIRFVVFAGRGTSDNAAVYGEYLATILAGLPAGLAVPSAATLYRAQIDLRDCLVIGVSQSGETPDVAEYVANARQAGAFTVAITNAGDSALGRAADRTLVLGAGQERAVAATKTYTAQLGALALFWGAWVGDQSLLDALREAVPAALATAVRLEERIRRVAALLRDADRLIVTGRGYNFATALEIALKVKETCYVAAMPYSAADLRHGPIALVEPRYPILLLAMAGPTCSGMVELYEELCARSAQVVVVTDTDVDFRAAVETVRLGRVVPEPLSPLVAVVPGQLLALHLSLARGLDPDRPRSLRKITLTR
jgi:glucosamine--fructose-6-phosphate aminotransferase (isomerizing)